MAVARHHEAGEIGGPSVGKVWVRKGRSLMKEETVTFRMKGENWRMGGEEEVHMTLEDFKALLSSRILLNIFQSGPELISYNALEDATQRERGSCEISLHAFPQARCKRFDNTWASQQTHRISEIDQHKQKSVPLSVPNPTERGGRVGNKMQLKNRS